MIQHYNGELGIFDYDDTEFKLEPRTEFYLTTNYEPRSCLKYIGTRTKGEEITIPDGIICCSEMFMGNKKLKSTPIIPSGVKNTNAMFKECTELRTINSLSDTILYANKMFYNCCRIQAFTVAFPLNILQAEDMFNGCILLEEITSEYFPRHLKICNYMFANCGLLKKAPRVPKQNNIHSFRETFRGCKNLENMCEIELLQKLYTKDIYNYTRSYDRCYSLCKKVKTPSKFKDRQTEKDYQHIFLLADVGRQGILSLTEVRGIDLVYVFSKYVEV